MKLWEALEKSNKVRRKGWDEDYYVEFTPDDRILKQGKEEANYIPLCHFKADDWELYNEPTAEPETDPLQIFKRMVYGSLDGNTIVKDHETFRNIIRVFEQQQSEINKLSAAVEVLKLSHQCQTERFDTLLQMVEDQRKILAHYIDGNNPVQSQ